MLSIAPNRNAFRPPRRCGGGKDAGGLTPPRHRTAPFLNHRPSRPLGTSAGSKFFQGFGSFQGQARARLTCARSNARFCPPGASLELLEGMARPAAANAGARAGQYSHGLPSGDVEVRLLSDGADIAASIGDDGRADHSWIA
jgi:hypothetical protein